LWVAVQTAGRWQWKPLCWGLFVRECCFEPLTETAKVMKNASEVTEIRESRSAVFESKISNVLCV
tara:strand:- start:85 stop:279 length:195 start_codon:yes stop_codon:yes gene_type:complete